MEKESNEESKLLEYIHGELDDRQRTEIEKQISGHEEMRVLFRKLYRDHLRVRWSLRAKLIMGDYPSVETRLSRSHRKWKIFVRIVAVAASIALLIGVTMLFFNEPSIDHRQLAENASEIHPGSSQATLVLSTGQMIPISKSMTEIQEQNNIHIQVNNTGVIEYPQLACTDNISPQTIMNQITTPRGGEFIVTLSDGSKIWLNADTKLNFPVQFTGKQREVYLTGDAYFEIAPDSTRPFIVSTRDNVHVKVFGTEFYVNTRKANVIQTVLVNGSVGINKDSLLKILIPNQKAEYQKDINDIIVTDTDVAPYIAWKDGNFIFNNETLESILDKLSLWYDFDVFYANDKIRDIRLSGDMKKYDKIESLLYFIEQISEVRFRICGKCLTVNYR